MFSFWNLIISPILLYQSALACNEFANTYITTEGRIKQYVFGNLNELDWFEANHFCTMNRMALVSIESEAESAFMEKKMKNFRISPGTWWTAGNSFADGINFYWDLQAKKKMIYTNWWENEPNNYNGNNENCVQLKQLIGESKWNDADCKEKHTFICEFYLGYARKSEETLVVADTLAETTTTENFIDPDDESEQEDSETTTIFQDITNENGTTVRVQVQGADYINISTFLVSHEKMNSTTAVDFCKENGMVISKGPMNWFDKYETETIAEPVKLVWDIYCFKKLVGPDATTKRIKCSEKLRVVCKLEN